SPKAVRSNYEVVYIARTAFSGRPCGCLWTNRPGVGIGMPGSKAALLDCGAEVSIICGKCCDTLPCRSSCRSQVGSSRCVTSRCTAALAESEIVFAGDAAGEVEAMSLDEHLRCC